MDSIGRQVTLAAVSLTVVALAGLGCSIAGAAAPVPGAELYRACVNCHGPSAAGSEAFGAPRIAGLPQWYIASQLQRFQDGLRGKHPDDYDGLRMRAMSEQMRSPAEIDAVASYVASLPPVTNPATLTGADVAAGKAIYARCVGCHGANGEGNQKVHAPPIAGDDDWYVARQLRKFRAGVRGTAEGDTIGPIMRPMSLSLTDEASVENVAAYVHTLAK